jgi:hypothetical protein
MKTSFPKLHRLPSKADTLQATYTGPASFTYTVTNRHGGTASAVVTITVAPPTSGLFNASDAPADITSWNDGVPLELGVKFQASASGSITRHPILQSSPRHRNTFGKSLEREWRPPGKRRILQ